MQSIDLAHAITILQGLDDEPRAQPLALNLAPVDERGRRGLRRNSFGGGSMSRKAAKFSPQELAAQRWLDSLAVRTHFFILRICF